MIEWKTYYTAKGTLNAKISHTDNKYIWTMEHLNARLTTCLSLWFLCPMPATKPGVCSPEEHPLPNA